MDIPQIDREGFAKPKKIIGSCSVCSGPVVDADWGAWTHPSKTPARCDNCGATAKTTYGPTIEMIPAGDTRRASVDRKAWADMSAEQRQAALNSGALDG